MSSDGDEDALSWGGDDALEARRPPAARRNPDPAQEATSPATSGAEASQAPASASASGSAAVSDEDEPQEPGTASLVLFGILGGVYLLYTIGWVIGGLGMQLPVTFTLPPALYQGVLWLAVLAPALWFAAVLVATRGLKPWIRFAWLIAGAVLLIPWPFVVAGGGGAL